MARVRNPRTLILGDLKAAREALGVLMNRWKTSGMVSEVYRMDDGRANHRWRDRLPEEYPENQAHEYHVLLAQLTMLRDQLSEMIDALPVIRQQWDERNGS